MEETHQRLAGYSTCEVSDALVKAGIPSGGFLPDITMFSPSRDDTEVRICGHAYTVQMVHAKDDRSPVPAVHFVDVIPEGAIVVISVPSQIKSAVWGGLMTAGAQVRQARGVIIAGRCRDLSEHRAAKFPVFARGQSTLGQSTFTRPAGLNVPLVIQARSEELDDQQEVAFPSVHVEPGDYILADLDGVVCIPASLAETVIEACSRAREVDAKCLEDIKNGFGVQESFKKWRGK